MHTVYIRHTAVECYVFLSASSSETVTIRDRFNYSKEIKMSKIIKALVTSPKIYKPVGPYSQAVLADRTLYVSGVLGLDAEANFVPGGIGPQTRQALENLKHVLEAGGSSLEAVVKTTILLQSMTDYEVFNKVYAEYFPKNFPARAAFEVAKLPKNAAVEIEAIALTGDVSITEYSASPSPHI